jgi:chromate transporter
VEKLRGNAALNGALTAITAAVCGVILNLAVWLAVHVVFHEVLPVRTAGLHFDFPVLASVDVWALLLALGAAVAIFQFKAGMLTTLTACCAAGLVLHAAGLT